MHHIKSHQELVKDLASHTPFHLSSDSGFIPPSCRALVLDQVHTRENPFVQYVHLYDSGYRSFLYRFCLPEEHRKNSVTFSCFLDGGLSMKVKAISMCAGGLAGPWDMSLWSCDLTSPQNCNYHVTCSSAGRRNRLGSCNYFWKYFSSR